MKNNIGKNLELLALFALLTFSTGCGFKRTPDVEKAIQIAQEALNLNENYDLEEIDDNAELEKKYNKLHNIYKKALNEAKESRTTKDTERIEYTYYAIRLLKEADKSIDASESINTMYQTGAYSLEGKKDEMFDLLYKAFDQYVRATCDNTRVDTASISGEEFNEVLRRSGKVFHEAEEKAIFALDEVKEAYGMDEYKIFKWMYKNGMTTDDLNTIFEQLGMSKMEIDETINAIKNDGKKTNDEDEGEKIDFNEVTRRLHEFFVPRIEAAKDEFGEEMNNLGNTLGNVAKKGEDFAWNIIYDTDGLCAPEDQAYAGEKLGKNDIDKDMIQE